jgi:PPK2 family polyphosphate:nucleotide phosphotransferase
MQDRLFAQDQWSLLLVFQAMDAAGKDSTVKHVMTGMNPRGIHVYSFGAPSKEELDHDYLWRTVKALPERGCIAIHNRSHYEEVIATRVHPEILSKQRIPDITRTPDLIRRRYREINRFERYLVQNGTIVLKFFLHVSKHEQWERLVERMENPDKYWKAQVHDLYERKHWAEYMRAYEDVFHWTSTPHAPWFVIPADHKWFVWLAVAEIISDTLSALNLEYPKTPEAVRAEWEKARAELKNV